MGTANLLQAVRSTPSVRAVVVVTSDKVYENKGAGRPLNEDEQLGGPDPYSNSKVCAELVIDTFRSCFSTARAASRRRAPATSTAAGIGHRSGSCTTSSGSSKRESRSRCATPRPYGPGSTCLTRYVWSSRALQEFFVDLADAVLHQCIRSLIGALVAPNHHGYQRACDLISGQASTGANGSPVFACAGKTDPPLSAHPLADLGRQAETELRHR
jgi:hypothetical protein